MPAMCQLGSKRGRESVAAPLMDTVLNVGCEETRLALQDEMMAALAA